MEVPTHIYGMVALYILAGVMHFVKPKAYMHIMPRYLTNQKALVYASGIAEILLGIGLCFDATRTSAIYGIIAMLIVFLLIHMHMLSGKNASAGIPKWVLILRIPLQFVLMYWAWWYLKY